MKKMNVLMAGVLFLSMGAHAADTGSEALRNATDQIGKGTLHGRTSTGQACTLSFSDSGNGVLVGDAVLGTYTLTVEGGAGNEFDFIAASTSKESGKVSKYQTSQRIDGDDSPDEGGFHRGFTSVMNMNVTTAPGSLVVTIKNGTAVTCDFR